MVDSVLADGADRVRPVVQGTMEAVRHAMHLAPMSDATAASQAPHQAGGFPVELPVFTGPFRLLADLILEQKVDVCDVRIAEVTDGYLARADDAERWSLEEATWFLAICAVLLELKVARLTPTHAELDEDDLLGGSPDLAYARSLELARVPQGGGRDRSPAGGRGRLLRARRRPWPRVLPPVPGPMATSSPTDLAAVAAQLLRPPPDAGPLARHADPLHGGRGA